VLAPPAVSANADSGVAAWTPTVTLSFDVLANDSPGTVPPAGTGGYTDVGTANFDTSSLKLCGPGQVAPNCNLTSLTITGEGTYTVNADATVTFDPVRSFTGTVGTSPMYQICNVIASTWSPSAPPTTCAMAPITPTITPLAPLTLLLDTTSGAVGEVQQINLIANDTVNAGLKALTICGINEVAPNCTQTQVSVENVGSYIVVGGNITFTPLPGFEGLAPSLSYTVVDELERIAFSTYTPYVVPNLPPTASPETKTFVAGVAQSFSSIIQGLATQGPKNLSPALTCIVTSDSCVTRLETSDGTWTVESATGEITFLPKPEVAAGTKASITYRVTDEAGKTAQSTLTPVIAPPPVAANDIKSTAINTGLTFGLLGNDAAGAGITLDQTSVKFCVAG
jgi:CshA-type fibril repeat protein